MVKTKIMAGVGEKVEKGQILFQTEEQELRQILVAKELGIKNQNLEKYLLKNKGDRVEINDILAVKKTLLSTKFLKSPVSGLIAQVDDRQGWLTIAVTIQIKTVKSMVRGEIVGKHNGEIEIKFSGEEYTGQNGFGDKEGKLLLAKEQDETVDMFSLTQEFCDAIVLGNKWSRASLIKAKALGCAVIGMEFPEDTEIASGNDFKDFAILAVNQNIYTKLKSLANKPVYLAGSLNKIFFQP